MGKLRLKFPDGSVVEVDEGVSARELLRYVPQKVAKEALCAKIGENLIDLGSPIKEEGEFKFITFDDPEGKSVYWHSTSHIMAQAVRELFPGTKIAIGPSIDEGFYYDFDPPRPFQPEDLKKIEERMRDIIKANLPFERKEITKRKARQLFKDEPYKLELIDEIPGDSLTIYTQGSFTDLCRGPHIPSTGYIKAFKLLSIAGAYWRGVETNPMLQRIYGISFPSESALKEYLVRLEEASKRDHRRLGKELDLFGFDDEVGPGLVLWYPKGAIIRKVIENFWHEEHLKRGYSLIYTPHIARYKLWQISGHTDFYSENMFPTMEIEGSPYQLKPMNCPFHIVIYKKKLHSYREFPIRFAELGTVYRYERSGVLHGLMRVRGFTQDDAHIFCRQEELESEIRELINFTFFMLARFGFSQFEVHLSTRPEKFVGSIDNWDLATEALQNALNAQNVNYVVDPGEGAFYGPKIDVNIKDALGRVWQCSTIQVDFNIPERFELRYMDADGTFKRPIMIHRALFGSIERFMGVLLEYYGGYFPLWLAPVQVVVMPLGAGEIEFSRKVWQKFIGDGFRAELDDTNEKINSRIRAWEVRKTPYMIVIGPKEVETKKLAIRKHKQGEIGVFTYEEFVELLRKELKS